MPHDPVARDVWPGLGVWVSDDLAQAGVQEWWKEKGVLAMAQDFVDYVDSLNELMPTQNK